MVGKRIFVVEDEAVVAMELRDQLAALGYDVCGHAARASSALDQIPRASPDLVLMDINLGTGPTGVDVARELQRRGTDVPVVFVSAYADDRFTQGAIDTGSYAYIIKPFHPHALKANIELALGRRDAERRAHDASTRYRRLFTDAVEGIFTARADTTLVDVNPTLARMLGYASGAALVGQTLAAATGENDLETAARVSRAERAPAGDVSHARWRTARGKAIDVEVSLRCVEGDEARFEGYVRDITRERRHEAVVSVVARELVHRHGDAFFDAVAHHLTRLAPAGFGFVRVLVPGAAPLLRTLAAHVDGRAAARSIEPLAGAPCEYALLGRYVVEDDVRGRHPGIPALEALPARGFAAVPLLGAHGVPLGALGVATRERIDDAEALFHVLEMLAVPTAAKLERHIYEARFQGPFERAADAIFVTEPNGSIVQTNRQGEMMMGRSSARLLGTRVQTLLPEVASLFPSDGTRGEHENERRVATLEGRRADGTLFPADVVVDEFPVETGRLLSISVRDATEREANDRVRHTLEEQLRHAQKMQAIGTLAGGIAHDFNNLSSAIVANVDLARDRAGQGIDIGENLDAIGAAAARGGALVRQILAYARKQPTARVALSLANVAHEAAVMLRATLPAGIELDVQLAVDAPAVLGDATQLLQVVVNLGTNAWHAIESGRGRLTLRVDRAVLDDAGGVAMGLPSGVYARLRVTDTGVGMSPGTAARIFEPFFTTKGPEQGTGLGLSVVHGIVEEHRGSVRVESEPGRGTTFTVLLRPAEPGAAELERRPTPRTTDGGGRILFVDDEPAIVLAVGALLKKLGYEPTCFVRPADALSAFEHDPAAFDVLITDFNMPGISGLEVARAVHRLRPDMPIILVSGYSDRSDAEVGAAGVTLRLEKPFGIRDLADSLRRARLAQSGSSDRED